jgi:hypothetical protein
MVSAAAPCSSLDDPPAAPLRVAEAQVTIEDLV